MEREGHVVQRAVPLQLTPVNSPITRRDLLLVLLFPSPWCMHGAGLSGEPSAASIPCPWGRQRLSCGGGSAWHKVVSHGATQTHLLCEITLPRLGTAPILNDLFSRGNLREVGGSAAPAAVAAPRAPIRFLIPRISALCLPFTFRRPLPLVFKDYLMV